MWWHLWLRRQNGHMMSKHQKFMMVLGILARDGISVTMDQRETGLYLILRLTRWPAPFAENIQRTRISKISLLLGTTTKKRISKMFKNMKSPGATNTALHRPPRWRICFTQCMPLGKREILSLTLSGYAIEYFFII